MKKINILYAGAHAEICETVVRLLNNNAAWYGVGVTTGAAAIEAFKTGSFDVLLLGSGLSETSEDMLRTFCTAQFPAVKIIQHYGGGSGLLLSEIESALAAG